MRTFKKSDFCIVFLVVSCSVFGQSSAKKEITKNAEQQKPNGVVTAPATATVTPNDPKPVETTLTPEQQGFTKTTINGKEYYVKQSGQMIIYYEPKK